MSDLDGTDAFEAILDRLIDAERRLLDLSLGRNTCEQELSRTKREASSLLERNASLAADLANKKAELEKMTKAARAVIEASGVHLKNLNPSNGFAVALHALDSLFDDIPF